MTVLSPAHKSKSIDGTSPDSGDKQRRNTMIRTKNPLHRMWPLAAVASIAIAFLASGCMSGTVRTAAGVPVAGVTVTYTDSGGRTASTTTDANGEYVFGLPPAPEPPLPGAATFNLSAPGFAPLTETRAIGYDDNPNASLTNPASFREVQDFTLTGAGAPPPPPPLPPPGGSSWGILTADLAVTDIYPDNQPQGRLYTRVTNHGPQSVNNVQIQLSCSRTVVDKATGATGTIHQAPGSKTISLDPGKTVVLDTHINIDLNKNWYVVTCEVGVSFKDPHPVNNSFTEQFGP